ncbi:MAG: hypothetical protein II290_09015 [Oscillospiraceae bacterium]|nr:hypothetical protein [Oscillospiraceae bacterium]
MKLHKKLIALLTCILLTVSLVGCAAIMESMEDPQIRTYTERMLDAILDGDITQAQEAISDAVDIQDLVPIFTRLRGMLSQVQEYELKLISFHRNTNYSNGTSEQVVNASYRMDTDVGVYVVDVRTQSGYDKLVAFVVTPYEQTDHYRTGDLSHMAGAGIAQWIVLLSNIISYGLIILAIVHCWRKKTKGKAGWIALCLLAAVSVGVTIGPSTFRFNFHLNGVFGYSAFLCYGGGTKVLRLLVPVGAVAYLLFGRKERKQETPWVVDVPAVESSVVSGEVEDPPEEMTERTDDGQVTT